MRVLILHNPTAGRGQPDRDTLIRLIRRAGDAVEYRSSADMDDESKEALDDFDLCVAAGGDGTVAKLGRALAGSGVPIAVLPLGTANNIAAMLGLPDAALDDQIAGWARYEQRRFDVGVARGPWGTRRFLESAGIGLLAHAISRIDADVGDGVIVEDVQDPDAQLVAARAVYAGVLETLPPSMVQVTMDGRDASGRYLLLEVMNCSAIGPALRLAPTATPHDGLLDLVAQGEDEREQLLNQIRHIEPPQSRALGIRQGERVSLEISECVLHIDDWVWTAPDCAQRTRIEIAVEPGALLMLSPEGTTTG